MDLTSERDFGELVDMAGLVVSTARRFRMRTFQKASRPFLKVKGIYFPGVVIVSAPVPTPDSFGEKRGQWVFLKVA